MEYKITAEEFECLNKTQALIKELRQELKHVLREDLIAKFEQAEELSAKGLLSAWEQDIIESIEFDKRAEAFAEYYNIENTWWLAGRVDFNALFPYEGTELCYDCGGKRTSIALPKNSTWGDVWILANKLKVLSGDYRHNMIKSFYPEHGGIVCVSFE